MRVLEELSGRWVGFWLQEPIRGHMGMTLNFASGRIGGEGIDQIGFFTMEGKYQPNGKVNMRKRYLSHSVRYVGEWNGQMIFGKWSIGRWDSGEFEIWPEIEEEDQAMGLQELANTAKSSN